MMSNINLNLLRTLQVLLEECHVSRTAERLCITQSAVSRQLGQLRELYRDPLLVRDGNILRPTPRALTLRSRIEPLMGEIDALVADKPFDPMLWQQEFVFSSSDYVAQYLIPDVASNVAAMAPKVDLAYRLWEPSFLSHFHDTGIHLASTMLPEPPSNLSHFQIGEDEPVCVMHSTHPLANKKTILLQDLLDYSHVKVTGGGDKDSFVDVALKQEGLSRRIALKVPFFTSAVNTLRQSDYLMTVPEHIAVNLAKPNQLVIKSLPIKTPSYKYWFIWHPKYDQDEAHKWMRTNMKRIMESSQYSIK
ncbi:LysR family transcriptional regulator [Vibrio sp. NTOU-M3]|uniref:LysR family transcriptional regulator n=1 Tax=Vibrio sp. NTOU-M3 TaxID=3234954 RepID=UPI00349F1E21